ncbi:unnamed protein product [Echinostoma caproni]|uniref:Transmembrane protein 216 n=1 Tax=Echinostoma caproni TaxID=27848 RepID=A0A183B2U3_9TREM|nr:unnamed protein product [Echinostoma caproni]
MPEVKPKETDSKRDYVKYVAIQANHSSLSLQVTLHFNAYYAALFFLCELLITIFKGLTLPYKLEFFVCEMLLLFYFAVVEAIRIISLKRSNLLESVRGMILSICVVPPVVVLCVWIILWQMYTMYFEFVLTVMLLIFYLIEIIIGLLCIANFSRIFVPQPDL